MNKQLDIEEFTAALAVDRRAVQMLAEQLVACAGDVEGDFCVATLKEGKIHHHCVANGPEAVDQIVDLVERNAGQDQNVYFSGSVFRTGAIVGNKGRTEDNVVAVLMLCADFDGRHDPATRLHRLPRPPGSEVETSTGNYQDHYWLDRPYSAAEAKLVQRALSQSSGADACNSVEHLWRMPGTLNWPTAKKIKAGRDPVPFHARAIIAPEAYDTISLEQLRSSIVAKYPQAFDLERQTVKPPSVAGKRLSWTGLRTRLSWIHPRFDGSRPACYPAPSRKRVARPLPYDGGAWLSLALCLRDGNVPLLDAQEHDWIGLIEVWSTGALWFERTGEQIGLNDRLPEQGIANRLQGEARDSGRTTGVATIIDYAADGGCPLPPDDEHRVNSMTTEALEKLSADSAIDGPAEQTSGDDGHSISTSEDELAVQYVEMRHRSVKYIPELGEWAMLENHRWSKKSKEEIWEDTLPLARGQAVKAPSISAARKLVSRAHLANSEALMRGKAKVIVKLERWDNDPMLLNTPDGAYDLPSGDRHVSEQPPYCLKSTAVAPDPKGADPRKAYPLWHKFMGEITAGDKEFQLFLQRFIGYCLTGLTVEHAMIFALGEGGNGKGVFFNTLNRVFGDYAQMAPLGMFEASHNERHTTEMARLHGTRFVTAQETKKEARWDEVKIKAITGGDKITARWLFQKPFEFTPQCKLAIAGQHLPTLSRVDNAIKRRLLIVPFKVTFTNPDLDLPEKLWRERAGILRWAMDGTAEWKKLGLAPPAVVQEATRQYFSEQDHLGSWIAARCVVAPEVWAAGKDLHTDYCIHAQRSGTIVDGEKTFGQNLEARGFVRKINKARTVRGFAGIALRPTETAEIAETLLDLEEEEF